MCQRLMEDNIITDKIWVNDVSLSLCRDVKNVTLTTMGKKGSNSIAKLNCKF